MAPSLDQMLRPGERVVHRLPEGEPFGRKDFKVIALLALLVLQVMAFPAAVIALLMFKDGVPVIGAMLFFLALCILEVLKFFFMHPPSIRQALVTDRRVMWIGGRFRRRLVEVALGSLDRVAALHGKVTLFRRDGKRIELAPALPTDAPAFASAAASTAGVVFETD